MKTSSFIQATNDLEKQFTSVKKKLEHFQYNYPLGLDSVHLADKLLTDLLKTTQGFQEMKSERDKLKEQFESEHNIPLPLRNENSKLMKENNELHREIIKLKEQIDLRELSLSQNIKNLESEKDDLKFLLSQKDIHIKNIENESEGVRKKLNELLNKMYGTNDTSHSTTFTVNTKLGLPNADKILKSKTSMNIIGRKNEMEMTKGLDTNPQYDNIMKFNKKLLVDQTTTVNKEEWANDLKIADERAEKFRSEIRRLEDEKKDANNKLNFLERQINNRDLEIKRIQNTYLNSDNLEELKVRYATDNLKMTVEKLNSQVDFLNSENQKLLETVGFHNTRCKEGEIRKLEKEIVSLKKNKEDLNRKLETVEKNSNYSNNNNNTNKRDKDGNNLNNNSGSLLNNTNNNENISVIKLKEENKILSNDLVNNRNIILKLNEELKNLNSNFNSERLALIKTLDALKDDSITSCKIIENLSLLKDNLTKQNEGLLTELNLLKGRELLFNKDFENKADNVSKIFKEYNEVVSENKNLRKKITELEERIIQINRENKELSLDRENLSTMKNNIEKTTFIKDEENGKIKSQFETMSRNLNKYETQLKVLEAKKKSVEEDNENLNSIIENKSNLIRDLEIKIDNYYRQLQESNDNYTTLQSEHRNLSSDFTEILSSKKKIEDKIRTYERDYNESKFVKEKLSEIEEIEKNLKNEIRTLSRENKALKNELKSLNDIISESKSELENLRCTIKVLEDDKKRVIERLECNSNDLLQIEESTKHLSNVSNSLEEYKSKISELNNKILEYKTATEKLKSDKGILEFELKKKGIEISKVNENLQRREIEFKSVKMEIKSINEDNEKLREEVLMKKINENNNIEITTSLLEIKECLDKEKHDKEKLSFENLNLNEKLKKINSEKTNLETTILQLTNLLNDADKTREELFDKFREEMNKNKSNVSESTILKERERNMDGELNKLREENSRLKQGINSIDMNYDNLNNELDTKTEEISRLNILLNNLKEQNEDLTKKLSNQLNKGNMDSKRISERDLELKELKNFTSNLQNENNGLKASLNDRGLEIQDLNYDLRCLQNENQSLVEEITNLSKDREKLSLIKSQLEKNSEMVTQKFRSNELDLNEVYSSYKEACKENERLKQNLQIFLDENREAAGYIKKVEGQLNHYQNNISSSVLEKDNFIKKIDFLEKYNTELTTELARLKEELNIRGNEENLLRENKKIDREINVNYESHIASLNRQIAKFDNENRTLGDKINELNNRIEYMNHTKNQYDDNLRNFEIIINEERKKVHNLNSDKANLNEEINYIKEENKRIMNMINENRDIKELKNKILQAPLETGSMNNSRNTGRTPNFVSETVSSDDENAILKRFVAELNTQIEDLKRDLRTIRDENTRLMSERSIRENLFSERGMSNMLNSNSVSSNHSNHSNPSY